MNGRNPAGADRRKVPRCSVTLVDPKFPLRIHLFESLHDLVAGDFGDNRRGGDSGNLGVALKHVCLGKVEAEGVSIGQRVIWSGLERRQSALDATADRYSDSERVDHVCCYMSDTKTHRDLADVCGDALPHSGIKRLGVIESIDDHVRRKDDGRDRDWSSKGAPADLIDSRHSGEALVS